MGCRVTSFAGATVGSDWPVTCTFGVGLFKGMTMAEVLIQFDSEIVDEKDHAYVARVCGRKADDGLWDGWIEFEPTDGGPVLRTPRETKQPKRSDLDYWASGLTPAYLEGALERAIHPDLPDLRPRIIDVEPTYT